MEFRRKKVKGQNQRVRRTWLSDDGYRIVWRKEFYGVRLPPRFQACVRTLIPCFGGEFRPMWDFVNMKRRLIKTFKAAQEECEKHQVLWMKVCETEGVRAVRELFNGRLPTGLPLWARKKMSRRLYAILTDNRPAKYRDEEESCTENMSPAGGEPNPSNPTEASSTSVSATEVTTSETDTPASLAEGGGKSTTRRTRRTQLKATETSARSTVPFVEEAAKGQKKPAAKRTKKPSKRTTKRKTSTSVASASAKQRSRGSSRKKSRPSES